MAGNHPIRHLLLSSSIDLTLSDRRLYNYLLHNAFPKLAKQLEFTILLSELQGVYGINLPPIERLKESLRRLIRTLIEFEIHSEWVITNLLEGARLNQEQDKLIYSYPVACQELFSNPIILEKCLIQAHFTLKYSNLLYEILSDAYFSKQKNITLEISDLRLLLNIADNKLLNYSDLNRFVLIPAVNEINSYASFAIKYHTLRKGMKVTAVVFEMTTKKNIFNLDDPKKVLPVKRPRLFIDNPKLERAYAYLLNCETKERRKFFDLAIKNAAKKKANIEEDTFDQPDLWFKWVEQALINKIN